MPEPFTTSAPLVKAALVEAFSALPELEGVQVTYGDPVGGMEKEVLYLGKITWTDSNSATGRAFGENWAALGNRSREERYSIELVINVQAAGTDHEVESRAFALLGVVELYLRQNPTFSYAKLTQYEVIPLAALIFPVPDAGRESQLHAVIRVECRK